MKLLSLAVATLATFTPAAMGAFSFPDTVATVPANDTSFDITNNEPPRVFCSTTNGYKLEVKVTPSEHFQDPEKMVELELYGVTFDYKRVYGFLEGSYGDFQFNASFSEEDFHNGATFEVDFTNMFDEVATYEINYNLSLAVFDIVEDDFVLLAYEAETVAVRTISGFVTLIPMIGLILVAILTKHSLWALFCGLYLGSFILTGQHVFGGLFYVFNNLIFKIFEVDIYRFQVVIFSVLLGGAVAAISKSGGALGMAEAFGKFAKTPRTGQLASYFSGWLIFFDDYANSMIAGNAMRPITDSLKISREKLAFIVDATSAPVASIMPVSSWIAFELGQIKDAVKEVDEETFAALDISKNEYDIFLNTIGSRFYPLVMLFLQLFIIVTGMEFGPMLLAERRSRYKSSAEDEEDAEHEAELAAKEATLEDGTEPEDDTPRNPLNGLIPIFVIVFATVYMLIDIGKASCEDQPAEECPRDVGNYIKNTDSYAALAQGGAISCVFVLFFYRIQYKSGGSIVPPTLSKDAKPLLSVTEGVDAIVRGITNLTPAMLVLMMAWALGDMFKALGANDFLRGALEGSVDKGALPALSFIISSLIALCIGSSWATMRIVFPVVIPLGASSGEAHIFYGVISGVLAGSVYGDHCSPISDTTVLSTVACRCDLHAHVTTQIPYATLVAVISTVFGSLITGYTGMPSVVALFLCIAISFGLFFVIAAPVNSTTGRLDLVNRLVYTITKNDEIRALQEKAVLAEMEEPTFQFDPLSKVLGGGLNVNAVHQMAEDAHDEDDSSAEDKEFDVEVAEVVAEDTKVVPSEAEFNSQEL